MERKWFDEGLAMISMMFRRPYKPETINAIWDAVKDEPGDAIVRSIKRVEVDFHPDALVPISKIRDIILAEGKKIREAQTVAREREAQRQKDAEAKSLPDGHTEYSRAVCDFLNAALAGVDRSKLRTMAQEGARRFPRRGFEQWLNGALGDKARQVDRMQKASGE